MLQVIPALMLCGPSAAAAAAASWRNSNEKMETLHWREREWSNIELRATMMQRTKLQSLRG